MEGKSVKGKSIQNSSIKVTKSKGLSFVVFVLLGIFGVAGAVLVASRFFTAPQDATVAGQIAGEQVANPNIEAAESKSAEPKVNLQVPLLRSKDRLAADATSAASTKAEENAIVIHQGGLRIGNLSDHPIRVALLIKKPNSAKDPATPDTPQTAYEPPAHWDFDPGEGSTKGLIVSLPNRKIKLKKGDVLVAFAQDGSRQYWGPYVVGETSTPVWSPKTAEWELILQP